MKLWTEIKLVPGTSVVNGGVMLLNAEGRCVGLVTVMNAEGHVRTEVERILNISKRVEHPLAALQATAAVFANLEKVTDNDDGECNHIPFSDVREFGGQMLDLIGVVKGELNLP